MQPTQSYVRHTGEEWYEVMLTYTPEQKAEIDKVTDDNQIVVDTVVLMWTRKVGQGWERYTNGRNGSRAEGNVKVANGMGSIGPRKSREIYTRSLGELARWTERVPGLRLAVEEVEATLPR